MLSDSELLKLPCGISDFQSLRVRGRIYVDKTDLIYKITREDSQPVFFSRPRRFGKSLLLSTIDSWFSNGRKYFEGLKISSMPEEGPFQVLHLDFSKISNREDKQSLGKYLAEALNRRIAQFAPNIAEKDLKDPSSIIDEFLDQADPQSVVLLIDEYDDPLIARIGNQNEYEKALTVYQSFFKIVKSCFSKIRFCMLTGVAKFSQTSVFSGFNTIYDCTFLKEYSSITGFTHEELDHYFKLYIKNLAQSYGITYTQALEGLTAHYDGYCFDTSGESSVFNPWSVLCCLKNPLQNDSCTRFDSYWSNTAGLSSLTDRYFKANTKKLNLAQIFKQLSSISIPIKFDYKNVKKPINYSNISLSSLLLQTGYLTIRSIEGEPYLVCPNEEIRETAVDNLKDYLQKNIDISISSISHDSIQQALYAQDPDLICQRFNEILCWIGPSSRSEVYSQENIIRDILTVGLCTADFIVSKEVEGTVGRADLLILNFKDRHSVSDCSIFEFKRLADYNDANKDEKVEALLKEAKEQIITKRYDILGGVGTKSYLYAAVIDAKKYEIAKIVRVHKE